jgi:hypothetical protein
MQSRRTAYGYALRLDPGEEIIASLRAFAAAHGIGAGLITALGAVGETELGFFDRASRRYLTRTFPGEHEIGSLTGNFSELDGQPHPHCHIVIAGPDFVAHTGHLFRGTVTLTCEVQVVTDPATLRRTRRDDLGISTWDLGVP